MIDLSGILQISLFQWMLIVRGLGSVEPDVDASLEGCVETVYIEKSADISVELDSWEQLAFSGFEL